MNETLKDFSAWNEVTKGLYRYVISAGACYEIHILYHDKATDIMSANASLYIVGDWRDKDGKNFFERECLLEKAPVMACLGKAIEDYKENCED